MESDSDHTVFDHLFRLLEPEAQTVAEGFGHCRHKLQKFFAWRHCEDPDTLADETVTRLVKNVRAGQQISADNPYSYVYAIATNVFKEYLRAKRKSAIVVDLDNVAEPVLQVAADDCQKQCFERLSPEKRELLAHYYLDDAEREDIASEEQLTVNALRLKIHRFKESLKRCYEECKKQSDGTRN